MMDIDEHCAWLNSLGFVREYGWKYFVTSQTTSAGTKRTLERRDHYDWSRQPQAPQQFEMDAA